MRRMRRRRASQSRAAAGTPSGRGFRRHGLGRRCDAVYPVRVLWVASTQHVEEELLELPRHRARLAAADRAPIELDLCERSRDTPPQIDLPWAARGRNVRGAFACRRSLIGASVAVVDDVMTTGATLDEVAASLKGAGAAYVVNWIVARTLPPN